MNTTVNTSNTTVNTSNTTKTLVTLLVPLVTLLVTLVTLLLPLVILLLTLVTLLVPLVTLSHWQAGRQMCEELSLTGQHCTSRRHTVPGDTREDTAKVPAAARWHADC